MARRPRTGGAVATAHQGGRPKSGLRHLLRRALALGGGTVDGLLVRPLRLLWRALPYLRSKKARRDSAAAAIARRHRRRNDPPPRETSLLRRAAARVGGAVGATLLRGRRALAVLHRALAALQRELSPSRALVLVHRLLRPPPPQPQPQPQPQPLPLPLRNAGAHQYQRLRRASPATTASSPPPSPPPPRRIFTVDGVDVPEGIVDEYKAYCHLASTCSANLAVCNFCFFEMQKSPRFMVPIPAMFLHCDRYHRDEQDVCGIRCEEAGCSVRVRPGSDQALHIYFCHRLPPGWWTE